MLRQVSIRALLVGYNLGDIFKILWIYISVGTGNLVGWRQGRLETRWAESRRVGNGQRALAQTALMMVGASEIGGSRLTLDELSPDSLAPRLPRQHSGRSATQIDTRQQMATDDDKLAGGRLSGRAFSFSHYTTEGIFIHGDPAFRPPLEPPRPQAAAPRRRRARLEWEFSLPLSGNCPAAA